jgi:hypothetical protein
MPIFYIYFRFGLFIKDHRVITVKEYNIYEELLKICDAISHHTDAPIFLFGIFG